MRVRVHVEEVQAAKVQGLQGAGFYLLRLQRVNPPRAPQRRHGTTESAGRGPPGVVLRHGGFVPLRDFSVRQEVA